MNKKMIASLIIAASVTSASAFAADGTVKFEGQITDDACKVVNDTTNPLLVTLGTVSTGAFTGTGSTAAPTGFSILLEQCPAAATKAQVKFDGTPDSNNNTLLAVTGGAAGVGIEITDHTGAVVPLFTGSTKKDLVVGSNSLDFVARYKATQNVVVAGTANATSNFTIVYN